MRTKTSTIAAALLLLALAASAQEKPDSPGKGSAITIYNQNFALVRTVFPMELTAGVNRVRFADATAFLEPESVILRDLNGRTQLQVLEQNYRNDPITQELLLYMYEGKTIEFEMNRDGRLERVPCRIVRSGYVPHPTYNEYGQAYPGYGAGQPIIEVDGKLRFGLPGLPIFPNLGADTILHPTISWLLNTPSNAKLDAEVSYVTSGMSWAADYNIVAPVSGAAGASGADGAEKIDVFGSVTFTNRSGMRFDDAQIKLIAGDINKLPPGARPAAGARDDMRVMARAEMSMAPTVKEKSFDEYHMYSLARAVTLHDNETKQVEFVRGTGVNSKRIYVYDGAKLDRWYGYTMENARNDQGYGTESNPKVWVMQEFKNSKENGLGIALPKGKLRFYRRDDDGKLEFTGENWIDHTPVDELIRVYTGNAFDVVGERRRTDIKVNSSQDWLDESFEIKVRNHKKTPVTVRVVEHLYRWTNWTLTAKTTTFKKKDSQTIEFPVTIPPSGEAVITYTVHYSW
ncbi:MAG: hypothetical protein HYX28_05825 [Candidatus Koribacter versatilis]|uniref:DUF4139 domain-containing protein n=1 Tax=Candidatus Korobacter versatilis TaxID=658062 RepID=A0A932EQX3_9BACT|nr:hypothetical protein [Candidatus Koribacter versatilis]